MVDGDVGSSNAVSGMRPAGMRSSGMGHLEAKDDPGAQPPSSVRLSLNDGLSRHSKPLGSIPADDKVVVLDRVAKVDRLERLKGG